LDRRLTTILAADVVGYSRLMGNDEAATLAALKAHRAELIDPKAERYGGRVIKLMGDGILMEFASVVDAVNFATDVQRDMARRNRDIPEDRQIQFRVGINIGDVIVEDDDIYGDGVNVAARLEGIAEPGGICIGRSVRDQIRDKLELALEDLGEVDVKNIARPVCAFRVLLDGVAPAAVRPPAKSRPRLAAGLACLVLVAAGALIWWQPWAPEFEPARPEAMALPLPDKPSIAVLPFSNFSPDGTQDYFADGMTEDLITDLSNISGLFVIARNSSFSYKGRQVKIRQVAEELGVRYVLEGSVRRAGDQVRINAQLIDATTGGHVWAKRYDGSTADVFALQDKVTKNIVTALAVKLTPGEARRVAKAGTKIAEAYDAYLLGLSFYHRRTPTDNAAAKHHLERAIQLDPDYTVAYTALAKVYVQAIDGGRDFSEKLGISWFIGTAKPWKYLQKTRLKPDEDYFIVRSRLALKRHYPEQAIVEAKRALELDSNNAEAMEALAEALVYAGQPKAGIEHANRALRQNPAQPGRPLFLIGLAKFAMAETTRAVKTLKRAIEHAPNETNFPAILAAAYGELGRKDEARAAFDDFNQNLDSLWTLHELVALFPFSDAGVLQRFAQGLKNAGLTVHSAEYLPLDSSKRLIGPEIRTLLFGKRITGKTFWDGYYGGVGNKYGDWQQSRTSSGTVKHSGFPIQPGVTAADTGTSRIENDALCEVWPALAKDLEICYVVFRIADRMARIKWGDYAIVTEAGPYPFSVAE
jgi:TolB-like protein/class 3 adenylate cyclase